MFCSKTNYEKMEQIQKKFTNSLQKVSNVPGRATWWIYDQAIRAHRKHILYQLQSLKDFQKKILILWGAFSRKNM